MTDLYKTVHQQSTDPGSQWVKDPEIVIDVRDATGMWRALTPNVVEADGRYYTESAPGMDYRAAPASILSAFSEDGGTWRHEPGVRPVPPFIEVPHHHVEVTRAIYKSAAEGQPVTLPLDKRDPFYTFEGRLPGTNAAGRPRFSSGHEMQT